MMCNCHRDTLIPAFFYFKDLAKFWQKSEKRSSWRGRGQNLNGSICFLLPLMCVFIFRDGGKRERRFLLVFKLVLYFSACGPKWREWEFWERNTLLNKRNSFRLIEESLENVLTPNRSMYEIRRDEKLDFHMGKMKWPHREKWENNF